MNAPLRRKRSEDSTSENSRIETPKECTTWVGFVAIFLFVARAAGLFLCLHYKVYDLSELAFFAESIMDILTAFVFLNMGVLFIKNTERLANTQEVKQLKWSCIILIGSTLVIHAVSIVVMGFSMGFNWVILLDSLGSIVVVVLLCIQPVTYVWRLRSIL